MINKTTTMDRRSFLASAALAAVVAAAPRGIVSAQRKPNIIYILADDLGWGDLGCYGQKEIKTPVLDRMAAEGMRFFNHYSGSTVCAPCRATLMTGRHTGNLRTTGQGQSLLPEDVTVAEVLKEAGYATGVFGKWGLGQAGSEGVPNKQGFDEWFGFLHQGKAHFYYPPAVWENEREFPIPGNAEEKKEYIHDYFTDRALKFIRDKKNTPFFLYYASTIPHAELAAPEESIAPYRGKFVERPYEAVKSGSPDPHNPGFGYGSQPEPRAVFAGMVTRLDSDIGKIFALLKELDLDEDTIVFFGSDNGTHKEGGHDPAYFDSNGPLRGIKRDLYDGGIRTPFIVRWPGKIQAGSTNDHVSAFWDFLPTAAELSGGAAPGGIDGISYLPSMLGRMDQQRRHEYLYWEMGNKQAARKGKWKAVHYEFNKHPDGPIELFDLDKDIGETTDLAARFPEVAQEMLDILRKASNVNSKANGYTASGRQRR